MADKESYGGRGEKKMNRAQWEAEKQRLIKEAEANLREFVKHHCGRKELKRLEEIVAKYRQLSNLTDPETWDGSFPKHHLACCGQNYDEIFPCCEEIVHADEWEKEGWSRLTFTCGHPTGDYFCRKHKEDCERRSRYYKVKCRHCEER